WRMPVAFGFPLACRLRDAMSILSLLDFPPPSSGEVAPSYGVGGVMGIGAKTHDPSAPDYGGTSPEDGGGDLYQAILYRLPDRPPSGHVRPDRVPQRWCGQARAPSGRRT